MLDKGLLFWYVTFFHVYLQYQIGTAALPITVQLHPKINVGMNTTETENRFCHLFELD